MSYFGRRSPKPRCSIWLRELVTGAISASLYTNHKEHGNVKRSVEIHAHVAASKSILLRALPRKDSDIVQCDRDRISQVLSNLVGNAIKFTPERGIISIEIQDLVGEFKVLVKDTGVGIAEDKKVQIFDRFAQIGNKDRSGLGLGLYISKMLVESHHGKLTVESTLGFGSTFCFTVPKKIAT